MKRQADNQITKDHGEDEDDEENLSVGMHKAPEEVLARRSMKGLPQRGGARPAPAHVPTTAGAPSVFGNSSSSGSALFGSGTSAVPSSTPVFGGFGGFGSSTSSTNTASASGLSTTNAFSLPPSSASPFTLESPSGSGFSASNATNTSKAFASLLNNTSPFGAPPTPSPAPTSSTLNIPSPGKDQNASIPLNCYTNLRGLNLSIVSAISKKVEEDPFTDISELLEMYKSYRLQIVKDFENPPPSNGTKTRAPATPSPAPSSNKPTMPAPPSSFVGFGNLKSANSLAPVSTSSSTSTPAPTNLFDFKVSSSGFSSTPSSASNPFGPKVSKPSASPFGSATLGTSTDATATDSKPTSSSFVFGAPANTSSSTIPTSPFSFGSSSSSSGNTSTTSNLFGSSTSTPPSFFSPKPVDMSSDKSESTPSSNPFGVPEKTSSKSLAFAPVSETSKVSNSGSTHFGFGGSSSSAFGTPAASTEENTTEGESSGRGTPAVEGGESKTPAFGPNPLAEEGEGEQNENVTYESKARAYRWPKPEEKEAGGWATLGAGQLKLKEERTTGARRMLLRNSINGKVLINFNIYAAMTVTQTKAALNFVGHQDGIAQTYSVRLPSEEEAKRCKEELQNQIGMVKDKEK